MSKKLIAVASAAALALSALVGIAPASASGAAAAFGSGITGTGTSAAAAATVPLPVTNIMSASFSGNLDLTIATGDTVRVETTGGVRVLENLDGFGNAASSVIDVSKLGATSWTKTYSAVTNGAASIKVYTTSTAVGEVRVTITRTGLTYNNTLYLKGAPSGAEYNIVEVTGVPATLAKGASADITYKVTDSLGNALADDDAEAKAGARITVDGTANTVAATWDAAAKLYKAKITSPSSNAFIVKISSGATDIVGYADAVSATFVVNNTTQAAVDAQVAALTAQISTMRTFERSVTKKRFNTLARKWNAAFPSQAVKLKPPLVK